MNCSRFVWVVGALGLSLGCSGRFEVGKLSNGGTSGTGSEVAAGGAFTNPVFVNYAGSAEVSSGGASSGQAGSFSSSAGSPSVAGAANASGGYVGNGYEPFGASPAYCGEAIPLSHLEQLATPDVVWRRIQLFLLDGVSGPAPELPAQTTRFWAARQAMIALDSVSDQPAPGLLRFVNGWLPGSQRATQWASMLRDSSLRSLLTTDLGQDHGVGVLTDPVILQEPNLARRGAYIAEHIVCEGVPPPPAFVPPLDLAPRPGTRRTQFDEHRVNASCAGCHSLIDPYGISLEHFTPITGEYSDIDNGLPIDSSSSVVLQHTGPISFVDAPDLGAQLASSCEAAQCLIQRLLADAESSAQLPVPGSTEPSAVAEIGFASYQSGHNLRALIWYLVQSDTFLRP